MSCSTQKYRKKNRTLCVGDLVDRIVLQNRTLVAPPFGSADATEKFDGCWKAWSAVNTVRGKTFFAGVNVEVPVTHEVGLRFDARVSAETWILFQGRRLDVLEVEDLEERHEWMVLTCTERGDAALEASRA